MMPVVILRGEEHPVCAALQCRAFNSFRSFSLLAASLPPVLSAHLLWHEGFDKETLSESTMRSRIEWNAPVNPAEKCNTWLILPSRSHLLRKILVSGSSHVAFTSLFTRTNISRCLCSRKCFTLFSEWYRRFKQSPKCAAACVQWLFMQIGKLYNC